MFLVANKADLEDERKVRNEVFLVNCSLYFMICLLYDFQRFICDLYSQEPTLIDPSPLPSLESVLVIISHMIVLVLMVAGW